MQNEQRTAPTADSTDLEARLRSSAKAFRENTVYDSEGDPLRLIVQADESDEAADALTALKAERDALRAAIAWVNEVHPTNCDGYARVGMTFEEFAAMKAALQQKDRNDEN